MATLEDRLLAPLAPRPAELVLKQAHDAIDVHMRAAVHRLSPRNRRIVEYHIGWTGVDGRPARHAGKAIRPALALLGAQAVGEPAARAMPGAVAVEMVHNFSLLQDDIMDGDVERRNRPAAWTVFGESQVLCASDALLVAATEVLAQEPAGAAPAALAALLSATQEMITGQSIDVDLRAGVAVGRHEYLALAEAKTGALLGGAAAVGALLAGAGEATVAALGRFGRALGVMFQVVDDILDIWGSAGSTGRCRGSDVRTKRASLPIICGLEVDGALLNGPPGGDRPEAEVVALLDAGGAYHKALAEAERHHGLALAAMQRVGMPDVVRDELTDLASYVLARAIDCRPVGSRNPEAFSSKSKGAAHER